MLEQLPVRCLAAAQVDSVLAEIVGAVGGALECDYTADDATIARREDLRYRRYGIEQGLELGRRFAEPAGQVLGSHSIAVEAVGDTLVEELVERDQLIGHLHSIAVHTVTGDVGLRTRLPAESNRTGSFDGATETGGRGGRRGINRKRDQVTADIAGLIDHFKLQYVCAIGRQAAPVE